jgi:hypothetical protein
MGFEPGTFCTGASPILQFAGWILTVFKWSIPILIIAFGMFDLGKAVVASKDDEIKSASKKLLYRVLAGVCIFFVPTVVLWLFGEINGYNSINPDDFKVCQDCVLYPWSSDCKNSVKTADK